MRKTIFNWFSIFLITTGPMTFAQQVIEIPAPSLELLDNQIQITYDILNSHPSESFNVNVEITNSNGDLINAKSFNGDIGPQVPGGRNKSIYWNFEEDEIVMNQEIFINVFAEKNIPASQELLNPVEDVPTSHPVVKEFNRTVLIIQSVVLPGWGLTKTTGNPHWIKGVAAYGSLAGAVVLNRAAIATYDRFLSAESAESADAFYSKSSRQDIVSESLVYVALGIWVTDLVWTIFGTSNLNRGAGLASNRKISLDGGFDAISRSPLIEFTYRF